jgi:Na+/melibiose symporter-like transporter
VSRRAAGFLYVFAGWTVFVWVVFIKNIAKSHQFSTGFKAIHIVLAIISIALAAGCFAVVRRVRRPSPAEPPVTAGR